MRGCAETEPPRATWSHLKLREGVVFASIPGHATPCPMGPIRAGAAHGHLWARPAASCLQVGFVSHRRDPSTLQALLLTPTPHSVPCKEDAG